MEPVHLSPAAHKRLFEEFTWRSGPRRIEISKWIETAREHGDIRENADFDAAKNEQGLNEGRIRQLDAMLKHAVVVDSLTDEEVVGPGVIVELSIDGDDDATTYLVGSIEERHDEFEVLSTSSPLGQALLGKRVGETVTYAGPRRDFDVEILSVRALS